MLDRLDRDSRRGALAFAVNEVLLDHGPAGLSLRRIGRYARMSPAAMLHHHGTREGILLEASMLTASARVDMIRWTLYLRGVSGLLPTAGNDWEMLGTRAWVGWLEMWRTAPYLADVIARTREEELNALSAALDHALTRPALESIYALADGLLVALSAPARPTSPGAAAAALECHARDLLRQAPVPVSRDRQRRLLRGQRAPAAA